MTLLLADEDFDSRIVGELRSMGHDVVTVHEVGIASAPDPDVLAFAVQQSRAVVTFNRRHFRRLHRTVKPHHGIIICTRDNDFAALARRIHDAIRNTPSLANQLLSITRPHTS